MSLALLALLQAGRGGGIVAAFVIMLVLGVIAVVLLAAIAVLLIILVGRVGRLGSDLRPQPATAPPRVGETSPTPRPEEPPTSEMPTREEGAPPGPTRPEEPPPR